MSITYQLRALYLQTAANMNAFSHGDIKKADVTSGAGIQALNEATGDKFLCSSIELGIDCF